MRYPSTVAAFLFLTVWWLAPLGFAHAAAFDLPNISCPSGIQCPQISTAAAAENPAAYVARLYQIALAVTGVIAVGIIVAGSLFYTFAGGSTDRQREGKEMITSALWGIALLFGSYLILETVNPDLVTLDLPEYQRATTTPASFLRRTSCSLYAIACGSSGGLSPSCEYNCDSEAVVKGRYGEDVLKCNAAAIQQFLQITNDCFERYKNQGGAGFASPTTDPNAPAQCHPFYKEYRQTGSSTIYFETQYDSIHGWRKGEWKFC